MPSGLPNNPNQNGIYSLPKGIKNPPLQSEKPVPKNKIPDNDDTSKKQEKEIPKEETPNEEAKVEVVKKENWILSELEKIKSEIENESKLTTGYSKKNNEIVISKNTTYNLNVRLTNLVDKLAVSNNAFKGKLINQLLILGIEEFSKLLEEVENKTP